MLRDNGHTVIGIDLVGDADIIADICTVDWELLDLEKIDGVVHLAAKTSVPESIAHPELYEQTNVVATKRLFNWCVENKIPSVIFASSAAVYGNSQTDFKSVGKEGEMASPYAKNKMSCENLARTLSSNETRFTCLRFFNVYGIGQSTDSGYAAVIPLFIEKQLNGEPLMVHGTGKQTRDFVNVDDVCHAIIGALTTYLGQFKIINVGTGRGVSILDLCNIVTSIASELGFQPVDVSRAPAREGDVDHSVADTSELELILSIKDLKPLSLGIKEQIISEFGKRKKIDVRGN